MENLKKIELFHHQKISFKFFFLLISNHRDTKLNLSQIGNFDETSWYWKDSKHIKRSLRYFYINIKSDDLKDIRELIMSQTEEVVKGSFIIKHSKGKESVVQIIPKDKKLDRLKDRKYSESSGDSCRIF